jgi:hypothetical protein
LQSGLRLTTVVKLTFGIIRVEPKGRLRKRGNLGVVKEELIDILPLGQILVFGAIVSLYASHSARRKTLPATYHAVVRTQNVVSILNTEDRRFTADAPTRGI